jgi:hypothetical protein
MIKGYFVQYKFIFPENTNYSSYNYQKIFRALYGYTQNVTKNNGKTYKYYKTGVLGTNPFIKQGKNAVIIPPKALSSLTTFFNSGQNPAHKWTKKGDWKAVYYMTEKEYEPEELIKPVEESIKNCFVLTQNKEPISLYDALLLCANKKDIDVMYKKYVLEEANKLTNNSWYEATHKNSSFLRNFNSLYLSLK